MILVEFWELPNPLILGVESNMAKDNLVHNIHELLENENRVQGSNVHGREEVIFLPEEPNECKSAAIVELFPILEPHVFVHRVFTGKIANTIIWDK